LENKIILKSCTSTQDIAKKNISQLDDLSYVVADEQTEGRGRFNRKWFSPDKKGLYISIIIHPELSPEYYPLHSFLAGMAVSDYLQTLGLNPNLKWPNDIMIDGKKICGILCDQYESKIIIGIGLNLSFSQNDQEKIPKPFCCLSDFLEKLPEKEIIIDHLLSKIRVLKKDSQITEKIIPYFLKHGYKIGKKIQFRHYNKTEELFIRGIDKHGFLLAENNQNKIIQITSGEIIYEN